MRASTCPVCDIRGEYPEAVDAADRLYRRGMSPHALHRHLQRALGNRAPSRMGVYRHVHGDRLYSPCLPASARGEHEFARRQAGIRPLVGAAAASAALGRKIPRGSAAFIEQVAQWLVQHQAIPRAAFEELGLDGSSARHTSDPFYGSPEEHSLARNWPGGWGRR